MNDKTAPCHDRIWLINMGDEIVWSDDPNPSGNVCPDDVSEFVSAEKYHALAAKVERLNDVWHRLHLKSPSPIEVLQAYSYIMRDIPETSLAALKAQWQAEALEELANLPRKWWPGELMIEANRIRRQAGGDV